MTKKPALRNPWLATRNRTGREYDAPYEARAAAGFDVHGEAALVEKLLHSNLNQTASPQPYRVLDAGCGTGRTAIELARRGMHVAGVDMDDVMLAHARQKAPQLEWHLGDLSSIALDASFDAIVMAGNVMIFLTPGTEAATVANMARHLKPGGLLIAAFEIPAPPWSPLTLAAYAQWTQAAALTPAARWSTWEQQPSSDDDSYAVVVHVKSSTHG